MLLEELAQATVVRFKSLAQQSTVQAAAEAFANARLGLIVVCDGQDRALGVVSKSDLVRHLANASPVDIPVMEIMTRSIVSAAPGDDLRATWKLMVARRLQNLPLLDRDRRPIGTLDIRDALQTVLALEEEQEDQLVNYIAGIGYR